MQSFTGQINNNTQRIKRENREKNYATITDLNYKLCEIINFIKNIYKLKL